MKFSKDKVIATYGHNFVLYEARGRNLKIYDVLDAPGVSEQAKAQPYHTSLIKDPDDYKGNPPEALLIREVVGQYSHYEDKKIGEQPGLKARQKALEKQPRHVFNKASEAEDAMRAIIRAADKDVPVRYEYLPGQIRIPALLAEGDTVFCFPRDAANMPLKILECTVVSAEFATLGRLQALTINAEPNDPNFYEGLLETFTSANNGKRWQSNDEDLYLACYFTRADADRGARRYAARILKNIRGYLPR